MPFRKAIGVVLGGDDGITRLPIRDRSDSRGVVFNKKGDPRSSARNKSLTITHVGWDQQNATSYPEKGKGDETDSHCMEEKGRWLLWKEKGKRKKA